MSLANHMRMGTIQNGNELEWKAKTQLSVIHSEHRYHKELCLFNHKKKKKQMKKASLPFFFAFLLQRIFYSFYLWQSYITMYTIHYFKWNSSNYVYLYKEVADWWLPFKYFNIILWVRASGKKISMLFTIFLSFSLVCLFFFFLPHHFISLHKQNELADFDHLILRQIIIFTIYAFTEPRFCNFGMVWYFRHLSTINHNNILK